LWFGASAARIFYFRVFLRKWLVNGKLTSQVRHDSGAQQETNALRYVVRAGLGTLGRLEKNALKKGPGTIAKGGAVRRPREHGLEATLFP